MCTFVLDQVVQSRGQPPIVSGGVDNMIVLKTTQSSFEKFVGYEIPSCLVSVRVCVCEKTLHTAPVKYVKTTHVL